MDGFHEVVNLCGFQDLGYFGPKFTWCNLQERSNRVHLKLDRAFANSDWLNMFGDVKVQHQVESTSDHCILRIPNSNYSPPSHNVASTLKLYGQKGITVMRLLRQLGIVVTPPPPLRGLLQILANVQLIYLCGTRKCLVIFLKKSKIRGIGLTFLWLKTMMVPKAQR